MVDDLAERWTPEDLDIREQTDTDLQITRSRNTRVADNDHVLHVHTETLRRRDGYDNWSQTLDVAIRVELAALIDGVDSHNRVHGIDDSTERDADGGQTEFTRADYDVAYTIPPEGWVSQQEFRESQEDSLRADPTDRQIPETEVLDSAEVVVDDRTINVSTPSVIHEMLTEYTDGTDATFSSLARDGVDRLLGLR